MQLMTFARDFRLPFGEVRKTIITFNHRARSAEFPVVIWILVALTILAGMVIALPVQAATCPGLTKETSLTGVGDFDPESVASGNGGLFYVAEYFADTVNVFSKNRMLIRKFSIKRPVAIAVDESTGNIYIGNVSQKSAFYTGGVTVYDKDFKKLRHLGSGWGEFEYPGSIEIQGSRVYVADNRSNLVKIFNEPDGTFISSFGGGGGRNEGDLTRPSGIAVDALTGNVYVSDSRLQYDAVNLMWGMGAGVHVFTSDGIFLRSLPIYFADNVVAGSQKMLATGGVQVDSSGRVFVADKSMNKLLVFNTSDTFICEIPVGHSAALPKGLNLTQDGRILLAAKDEVLVYATEDMVDMTVSPVSADISVQECPTFQATSVITVTNNGDGQLQWSASSESPWITLSQSSGSISGIGSSNVTIGADTSGLADGEHTGVVTFSSIGGIQDVAVSMVKSAAPVLSVAENSFSFVAKGNSISPAQTLNITLSGDIGGLGTWSASSESFWLGVSPSQGGSGLSVVQVGVNPAGLTGMTSGIYEGSLSVSSGCPGTASVVVPVSLSYTKGSTIMVSTNTDAAGYTITGPENHVGSGRSFLVEVTQAGTYHITFNSINGFMSPRGYSLEVNEGSTVEFTGNYMDLREDNKLIISSDHDGMIYMLDEAGTMLGAFNATDSGRSSVSSTASGDFDGDGADDIIVAHDNGILTGYKSDAQPITGMNFTAFKKTGDAVVLAAADLNGDGRDEILVSAGEGFGDRAEVRAFAYDGELTYNTGIRLMPYHKHFGTMIAAGDVDGDGAEEVITTRGKSPMSKSIEVRVFKADTAGGPGQWRVIEVDTFSGGASYGMQSVSSGDFNSDGKDEIVIAREIGRNAAETHIVSYLASGTQYDSFVISGTGLRVTSGDVDFDGHSEIVVTDGESNVRIYDGHGTMESEFKALSEAKVSGAKISLGQIEYQR